MRWKILLWHSAVFVRFISVDCAHKVGKPLVNGWCWWVIFFCQKSSKHPLLHGEWKTGFLIEMAQKTGSTSTILVSANRLLKAEDAFIFLCVPWLGLELGIIKLSQSSPPILGGALDCFLLFTFSAFLSLFGMIIPTWLFGTSLRKHGGLTITSYGHHMELIGPQVFPISGPIGWNRVA